MARALPPNPSLRYLQEQAKDLLKAHRRGHAEPCRLLRGLGRFADASDRDILLAEVSLADVQFALAGEYGFKSWQALKDGLQEHRGQSERLGLRQDGDEVWIDGVPVLGWSGTQVPAGVRLVDGNCTFIGALTAALAATDAPVDYPELLTLSGIAFTVRWGRVGEESRWYPPGPGGEFVEHAGALERATGWPIEWIRVGEEDRAAAADRIASSIAAGRCVLGRWGSWTVGVIYGRCDGGRALLLRDYWRGAGTHRISIHELAELAFPGERRACLSRDEAFAEAIRTVVTNWGRGLAPVEALPASTPARPLHLWHGEQAYRRWIADLDEADGLPQEAKTRLFRLNTWTCHRLYDGHLWGGRFLADRAASLDGDVAAHLEGAAELAEQGRLLIIDVLGKVAFFLTEGANCTEVWTDQVRRREQAVLGQLREIDASIVAELEAASAVLG